MLVPIKITAQALDEIKNIMTSKNIPKEYALRVGIKGGGCGGVSFVLGFDQSREGDQQFSVDGLPVLVEKRHVMFLMGMQVDFHESNEARGFVFSNPDIPERHDK